MANSNMTHANKMLIISPEALERLHMPAPSGRDITGSLDESMERILHMKNMTDQEKWTIYKQNLHRFLHFADQHRKPLTMSLMEDQPPAAAAASPAQVTTTPPLRHLALSVIPKTMRDKAAILYDTLATESNIISWTADGTISIRGVPLQGTSIVDLIADATRHRKTSHPTGVEAFTQVLSELNLPHELIGNEKRREAIQFLKRTAAASITPTHSARTIEQMYTASTQPQVLRVKKPRKGQQRQLDWIAYKN